MDWDWEEIVHLLKHLRAEDILSFFEAVEKTLAHAQGAVKMGKEAALKLLKLRDSIFAVTIDLKK